jgi:hypothetical protein
MARKKKQTVYDLHNQQYWRMHDWARPMSESYPEIASVKIELTFKDPDWHGDPAPRTLNFGPHQKSYFHMQCPYRECVRGGFDFSQGVKEAINNPSNEAIGRVLCDGWQDQERINKHHCMLAVSYRVTVERVPGTV